MERFISAELKRSSNNDIRFKLLAKIAYTKKQLIHLQLNIANKIVREINTNLEFKREKSADNVAPLYKIETSVNAKAPFVHRRLTINLTPKGRDINGDITLENAFDGEEIIKIYDGTMTLKSNSDSAIDYTVDIKGDSLRRSSESHIYGKVALNLLKSEVDLSVDFKSPRIDLNEPANIKLGHTFDVSAPGAKSNVYIQVKGDRLNNGVKLIFEANPATMKMNYLEVQITRSKNANLPLIIFAGNSSAIITIY